MSENIRCKRCDRVLTSKESIKRGYGAKCYRIITLQNQKTKPEQSNNAIIKELLDRVRKLELDNNFMKHQLKHKTIVAKHPDEELDWDIKPEIIRKRDEYKIEFSLVVKELKVVFQGENFDYRQILAPINSRSEIEVSPIFEGIVLIN